LASLSGLSILKFQVGHSENLVFQDKWPLTQRLLQGSKVSSVLRFQPGLPFDSLQDAPLILFLSVSVLNQILVTIGLSMKMRNCTCGAEADVRRQTRRTADGRDEVVYRVVCPVCGAVSTGRCNILESA
jgi:hypothetical protein